MTLLGSAPIGSSDTTASVAEADGQVLFLAELTVYDPTLGSTRVLRYSTGIGFITRPTESPADTLYDPRLLQPIDVVRSVFANGVTQGRSTVNAGDLVLANGDGALDALLSYAFDGRTVVIRRGVIGGAYPTEFPVLFTGTMEPAEFSSSAITITIRDNQALLDLPIQDRKYGGTNALPLGLDGVAGDLKGKPIPLLFGTALNCALPMVNTAKLILQANDGALASVDGVYDRGVSLTPDGFYATQADLLNDALAPAPGSYKAYLAGGYIRLGSSPSGTITADITDGATVADRTAAQLYARVLRRMGIVDAQIVANDLLLLDGQNAAPLGLYLNGEVRASAVLDQIVNSVGAWWGVNRLGQYRIKRLDAPVGVPVATFTANEVMPSFSRLPTRDANRGIPITRATVRYAKNYTVQTDLAGGVADDRRARLANEWREASAEDAAVLVAHLLAGTSIDETLLVTEADARAEAARRLLLRRVVRHRFEITTALDRTSLWIDLGDIVGLLHPRYDLQLAGDEIGRLFVVIGVAPDARGGAVTLTLWGNAFDVFNLVTEDGDFILTEDGDYLLTE